MSSDDPVDLSQVTADDALIDLLRSGSVGHEDPAVVLLRDLLADVEADLPGPAPVGRGSTVLALAGESAPERRTARNGAVVALLTAGLVSLGGVAAASTVVAPAHPLHGLGEVVRSAAGAVVDAVTPPASRAGQPAGGSAGSSLSLPPPAADAAQRATTTGPAGAPGQEVSAAARSTAAARQVAVLLAEAEQLLDDGRGSAAVERLDRAERRLADVLPADRSALADRLNELRRQVAAAPAPAPGKPGASKPDAPKRNAPERDAPRSDAPRSDAPRSDAPKDAGPESAPERADDAGADSPEAEPGEAPRAKAAAPETDAGPARTAPLRQDGPFAQDR